VNVEPVRSLVLLGELDSVAARRAIVRERKLVEVEQELTTAQISCFSTPTALLKQLGPPDRNLSIHLQTEETAYP
jgi:hypothetical protein